MKVEWKQSVLLVTIGGQAVPVMRVSDLRAELERILRIAIEPSQSMPMEQVYIVMQEELAKLLASLPKEGDGGTGAFYCVQIKEPS